MPKATLDGLNNFGKWMRRTRGDSSKWPPVLRRWFEQRYSFASGNILTQQILGDFLAEMSGSKEDFGYRVKTIEGWGEIDSVKATRVRGLKYDMALPLGITGFLAINGRPVFLDSIWIFDEVLKGNLNPLHDPWPVHPFGRGVGPRLATLMEGIVRGGGGMDFSLYQLSTRAEFTAGQYREKDIVNQGWFLELVEGKIFDVELNDLRKCAICIENFLRKYNSSTYSFDLNNLTKILHGSDITESPEVFPEDSTLPDSIIAVLVHYYCCDHDEPLKKFVTEEIKISYQRWEEIENGARPREDEFDSIATALGQTKSDLIGMWEGQYLSTNENVVH